MAAVPSRNPASIKVICVSLGRTGTSSMRIALEMLGFGPSYQILARTLEGGNDFASWFAIYDGDGPPEAFDELLRGYNSLVGDAAAINAKKLYAAYPDAKYILMTRDPKSWEKSMLATNIRSTAALRALPVRTQLQNDRMTWTEKYVMEKYHRGRLLDHAQQEFVDHNERMKVLIPPEKLLVCEISEGWDKLVEFLGVPKPVEEFPHANDTNQFKANVLSKLGIDPEGED